MKTGLGLYQKYRKLYAYLNLLRFSMRKILLGFDVANLFLQRIDKYSLKLILRKHGASIGEGCDIESGQIFHNCTNYSNLIIGNNCHIGKNCFFDLRDKIIIGDNVIISMQCTFITHIDMSKSPLREKYSCQSSSIGIQDNSYLGTKVSLLKGVQIGKGVVVAAGAVILKNVGDDVLVGGIPAKIIKRIT